MINKFGLKNFKSWRDESLLDLGKITLIFGQNSAGKSSVLQALSLLNESTTEFDLSLTPNPQRFRSQTEKWRLNDTKAPFPILNIENNRQKYGAIENLRHNGSGLEQEFTFSVKKEEFLETYFSDLQSKGYLKWEDENDIIKDASEKEISDAKKSLFKRLPENP